MTNKKPTPFEVAHAARKGEIAPESITGAARLLYRDQSLTDEQLADYATERSTPKKSGQFASPQPHIKPKLS